MELSLKQQIKVIRDVFRADNFRQKEFNIKSLLSLVGAEINFNPFEVGINLLNEMGIISVIETNGRQVIHLNDYDKLYAFLCSMDD